MEVQVFPTYPEEMGIGKRLKTARKRAGLSQKDLSELAGRTQTTVSEWENERHEPSPDMISRLAGHLKVRPEWLLLGKAHEDPAEWEGPPGATTPSDISGAGADWLPLYWTDRITGGGNAPTAATIDFSKIISRMEPPDFLRHNPDGFAIRMPHLPNEGMFRAGHVLWADPNTPARRGDQVLLSRQDAQLGAGPFTIGTVSQADHVRLTIKEAPGRDWHFLEWKPAVIVAVYLR